MAKIKISELAKELGLENKEVVSYLQEMGVEAAKRSTSSVEEEDAQKARKHFAAAKSASSEADNKDKAVKVEKASADAAEAKDAKADKEKKEKPSAASKESETKDTVTSENAPVKKKKKIIIVSNQGGYKQNAVSSDRRQPRNDNRPAHNQPGRNQRPGAGRNNSFTSSQNAYRPIKPLTAPSQLEYESNIRKTTPVTTPVKKAEEVKEKAAAAPEKTAVVTNESVKPEVTEKPAMAAAPKTPETRPEKKPQAEQDNRNIAAAANTERKPRPSQDQRQGQRSGDRNDSRQGGFRNDRNDPRQGGFRNDRNDSRQGGFRNDRNDRNGNGDRNDRGDRRGPSQGRSFGQGQGRGPAQSRNTPAFAAAPAPTEKTNRHSDKRIDKDKKSKKDYEAEENLTRNQKAGRFRKPEVKKEEVIEEQIKTITIPDHLTIKELAEKMKMQPSAIIKKLFLAGQIVTLNTDLSYEEAENIAIDYEIICEKEEQIDVIEELLKEDDDKEETLTSRPPVVCVMGHVDHGKTSLLDKIRDSSVTEKEAGGITQRIGAYMVSVQDRPITFLDTPGHEAFTAMRMRGANSTDIAVLVVAADDGVMPQTVEAINHAKAANIEMIVAVNKIDKPGANVDRVKQELTEYGLISTDWGGSTEFVPVSAKTGEGIDTLLETIILTADILELKANANRNARGIVLEAKLDKGRGPVANILVQKGTLHVGDFISAGASSGRVRAMSDDKGRRVKEAGPSHPVEILGLSDVPNAGEVFIAHDSDKEAKQYAGIYQQQHKKELIEETKAKMSLDDLYSKIEEGKLKELDIIIKADVQGSVEALKTSLTKLSNDEVIVKIIHGGVGAITESDVSLASASNAIIIGFDVRPDAMAKSMAEHEGVEIKLYKVIYQAIDDVEAALKGMLAPVYEEKITGHAEVRQIFKASAIGNIAGSFILDGTIQKGCKVRIRRGEDLVFEGDLKSLKRFKDDVKEVREGYECGLVFDGFDQMNVGDNIEAYVMIEVPRQ
ncbi:translation initiation factor IF-2 [Butyrivibrio sp. MC2013]|uniref:translation initiation factor IF-2 n=1 Tax=Butyrivibrio sp. MC2013 TaxID=1280686 RepID=UPI000411586D|nr:translation initiation factor IF-2 [Butyrivibrio sp. MC2013]